MCFAHFEWFGRGELATGIAKTGKAKHATSANTWSIETGLCLNARTQM